MALWFARIDFWFCKIRFWFAITSFSDILVFPRFGNGVRATGIYVCFRQEPRHFHRSA
jgi:hypothetical protein